MDPAGIITATALLVTAITGLVATLINARRIGHVAQVVHKVDREVTTLNGLTLAELGDATETRRIEDKPAGDRTDAEDEHVARVPPKEPNP